MHIFHVYKSSKSLDDCFRENPASPFTINLSPPNALPSSVKTTAAVVMNKHRPTVFTVRVAVCVEFDFASPVIGRSYR